MLKDLRSQGFHVCLWQLPYFTPKNRYFSELIEKDMYVKNGNGELPYEDVVLDFSNPETVKWYQDKLAGLLNIGVSAIKVDFGEAAPLNGIYASGKSGWYEHNLYPVRYDMAVSEITKKLHNENIMWARAAWAGSQRYPLHWGGKSHSGGLVLPLDTVRFSYFPYPRAWGTSDRAVVVRQQACAGCLPQECGDEVPSDALCVCSG